MTEIIMRLRKCAEELSQIADAMSKLNPVEQGADADEIARRMGGDAQRVVKTLAEFGVNAKVEKVHQGPTVNKIEISVPPGTRCEKITALGSTLMMVLEKRSLRIEVPVPGANTIGIEYDRTDPEPVTYSETTLLEIARLDALRQRPAIPIVVGKDIDYSTVSFDLATLPHLLIGGSTGQGKSMFIHSLINGLISSRSPEEVRLILFDPKHVEFLDYEHLPHLIVPVLKDNGKMVFALQWVAAEMEKRLKLFARARARNIREYNNRRITGDEQFKNVPETVPYIVIVLDEFEDLMLSCEQEVVPYISCLATTARAAGIHLVIATQQSECTVVTGTIKSIIPGRIAFKTSTSLGSRVLLDDSGAEDLIGKGDCLYQDREGILRRVQVPSITDEEIKANVEQVIARYSKAEYELKIPEIDTRKCVAECDVFEDAGNATIDELVEKAKALIRETGRASTSHFQRRLGWGYNRASEVIDELERRGLIGPFKGADARDVFMS